MKPPATWHGGAGEGAGGLAGNRTLIREGEITKSRAANDCRPWNLLVGAPDKRIFFSVTYTTVRYRDRDRERA